MKYYVFKLIPPRATFLHDMTAAEGGLMQAHGQYLRSCMANGQILVFGPVLDPILPYGLAVVRLDESTDPGSIWKADPVIAANVGFRYEVAPMLSAIVAP